ncbi:toxin [Leptospira selangorensis]|uniref:Toxin n=1 Tax=Leptospira selangorensis TaxID=2484982 RepID=A0A5F2C2L5_9LEPT|nr:toxin [Leptospira selangorensis]TGM13537.1 toxin [Leptospira selangorensis]TGM22122.1 toxin [Leptospira selangorensis]
MIFDWDNDKNETLKVERNISFERVVVEVESESVLDILKHPNKKKYPNQILMIVEIDNYAWVVPAIENKDTFFLKTAYPSRKYTSIYLPEANL